MATQTFELVSPFMTIYAPSKKFDSANSSLLLGQTANRLVAGELLELVGNNGVQRPAHTIAGGAQTELTKFVAPYFSETGRGDIITIGNVPILQFGPFEADTMVFERLNENYNGAAGQGSLANGYAGFQIGAPVYAASVRNPLNGATLDASNYVIGVSPNGSAGDFVVGRVSRLIGSGASAKIRVMFGIQ